MGMDKLKDLLLPPTKKDFIDYLEHQPFYRGPVHFIALNLAMTVLFYYVSWKIVTADPAFYASPRTQSYARTGMIIAPLACYLIFVRETKKFVGKRNSMKIETGQEEEK